MNCTFVVIDGEVIK